MTLRASAYSASRWTTASTLAATALQVAQTVALAHIVLPSDFGLMAVAGSVVAVLLLLVDLGLSQALIHSDDVSVESRSSIYWLNMLLALVLMLALIGVAPRIGALYQSEPLVPLLRWASLLFPLAAIGRQLRALAAKALQFDKLATIDVAAAALALACAIAVALLGGGVYALVAGLLASAAVGSLLAWLWLPTEYRPTAHFAPREALPYLGFGGYSVGETIANEFRRNSDVIMGGLVVGPAAMGAYSVSRNLGLRVGSILNSIVTKVGFPVMSQVKNEPERLCNIYMQTLRFTSSVNFPLYVFIGLFANEVVALLYGPRWHDAATYLRILAAWGLIRSTGNPSGSLIYAVGKTRRAFWWNIGLLILLPPLYWLATRMHGLIGLAGGVMALQVLIVIPAWRLLVKPSCGASLREYLSQFWPPLACALPAGALAWLAAHDLPHGTLRLFVGGLVGSIVYLGLSWFFNRRWALAMAELLHLPLRGTQG